LTFCFSKIIVVKQQSTEITGNLSSAYDHFYNLCLISADKIETFERPIT